MNDQARFDEASVAEMTLRLSAPDYGARYDALWRIRHAIRDRKIAPEFVSGIFPVVAGMLRQEERDLDAPGCLMKLDREKAIPILLSPECLCLENSQLEQAIDALNAARVPIPHRLLLGLLAELEPRLGTHFRDRQYGAALVAYGINPDGGAEQKLQSLVDSPIAHVAESAAWAMVVMNRLDSAWDDACAIEQQDGFDALSEPQKHYLAVGLCHAEIRNGGFEQYFGNSFADYYWWALDGLQAMNAPERAQIVKAAGRVFGPEGPPQDWDARREIVHALSDQQRSYLNALDEGYYASTELVEVRSSLYVLEHRESFGARD